MQKFSDGRFFITRRPHTGKSTIANDWDIGGNKSTYLLGLLTQFWLSKAIRAHMMCDTRASLVYLSFTHRQTACVKVEAEAFEFDNFAGHTYFYFGVLSASANVFADNTPK